MAKPKPPPKSPRSPKQSKAPPVRRAPAGERDMRKQGARFGAQVKKLLGA